MAGMQAGPEQLVPHTTVSPASDVPHTTVSPPSIVPHTTVSPSSAVPQTTVSLSLAPLIAARVQGTWQESPPQVFPQTTFLLVEASDHAPSLALHAASVQVMPNSIGAPPGPAAAPHVTKVLHALAPAVRRPFLNMSLPQMIRRLHPVASG